ncbi:CHS_3a_G0002190.mRNA.1.CDS.1 [Saccharomyces cerevisiae]|nr:ABA_G0002250.mRNA.1.CDS.1 [Saccharomyces cerevisiae]CAI4859116.1 CHS_3a_G0002190.mRNA.1.CDS.1 [Saccharomyces cerevisiae]CAI6487485.1 ABA_G0002250.mRNA.1.CDS.1 [Saccharomyces cerevisiae]CAI7140583.1 CHS_3a_G0002190.mRNA.1.CDS.1 [Saccharomyces cerevisiae]CAI7141553.1 CGH_1_collapsed_G0002190.mRNA.1.CDS.1 [Saccharomyces cerevisiae]
MSRPQVTVHSLTGEATANALPLPAVFSAPIRPDIVHTVFTSVNKNKRQAYAVSEKAGHQTSAESWGTGRAVARIPRVGGGGTGRSGQGAFGNMCRGGRIVTPLLLLLLLLLLPLWSWPEVTESKKIPEIPLVVSTDLESIQKTKEAVAALKAVGAHSDLLKVLKSKKLRAGKGKYRNRRWTQRRGPLVVYAEDNGIVKALRNVPGVETANVASLNLLQLAPGAHLGRFVIWTEAAFTKLDQVWGSETVASSKVGYTLPSHIISTSDVTRIINSSEIQSAIRPAGQATQKRTHVLKKNPLKNKQVLLRLNPYAKVFAAEKLGSKKAEKTGTKPAAVFTETLKHD